MQTEQGELFPSLPDAAGGSAVEAAAAATIEALRETGALDKSHSLKVELIIQGARALDRELQRHKVTIAAIQLFSRVVDIADGLPTVQEAVDAKFHEIAEKMADAD